MRPWMSHLASAALAVGALMTAAPTAAHAVLYVSSYNTGEILRYDDAGNPLGALATGLFQPEGLAIGPDGRVYVVHHPGDTNSQILGFNQDGTTAFASDPLDVGYLGLAVGGDGTVYASEFELDPSYIDVYSPPSPALLGGYTDPSLVGPDGLAFGPDGALYISNRAVAGGSDPDQILRFDLSTGVFSVFAGGPNGPIDPTGLTFGPDGNLYVASLGTNEVLRYFGPGSGTPGAFDQVFTSGSSGLSSPIGVAFGPGGDLLVSSFDTDEVLRFAGPGAATPGAYLGAFVAAGAGGLSGPTYLAYAPTPTPIPEPSTVVLAATGLIGLLAYRRRPR